MLRAGVRVCEIAGVRVCGASERAVFARAGRWWCGWACERVGVCVVRQHVRSGARGRSCDVSERARAVVAVRAGVR